MSEKKITVAKLAKFIAIRSTSLMSNMQFGIDLKSAGLTPAMLGQLDQYKDESGWSIYIWHLSGDLERTHRLIELAGALFLAPTFLLEIPDTWKHVGTTTSSTIAKEAKAHA